MSAFLFRLPSAARLLPAVSLFIPSAAALDHHLVKVARR
jgi:hypothetical protein